ncbi:sulfite exporter TauE/SafE family protein [Tranquillimonas alkanivorans]|uniref:Probable membrane transporter protein n=1 Tax=Tranquillimonas alkanivorans TaxID=441119 RepID=A0A1I5PEZ6_9RHOB|nr:sulfite exporter TauE/SafE family protein [Tranquillimonas alkanivorans]SFP32674.1 hypothetical protein SAMN04488047_10576 [Tranquillimonas alkanivorans]
MVVDATFLLFATPAVLFAGISKGGFGSGAAFAAAPFLALVVEPGEAIGLMLPLLMLMDLGAVRAYWRKWDAEAAKLLIVGSLPGIAAGAALYTVANADLFRLLIGLVALGFVVYRLARARGWLATRGHIMGRTAGFGWGAVAGLTSFISHAGGPPAAVYLLTQGFSKTTYQATTVITFWAINAVKLPPYLALGIFTRETLIADLFLAPVALLGIWLGVVLHRMVPDRWFFMLAYVFLTITGAKLIFDALT